MEVLPETHQDDLISSVLHNMMVQRGTSSEIERAMADYFDATTEVLEMCKQLLRNIKNTQSNYQSMDNFLAIFKDSAASTSASAPLAFRSFPVTSSPFRTTTRSNFRKIHERYSSILESIRSSHRRVARKLKIVKAVRKLSRAFLVMACSGAAAAVIGAASHLLSIGHLIGVAAAGLLPIALKRMIAARARKEKRSSKRPCPCCGCNLVVRLSDGIERENAMARCCEERSGERSSVLEIVNELKRSCSTSRRLTNELEEHVCLFLATIHRARILVIQEISKKA